MGERVALCVIAPLADLAVYRLTSSLPALQGSLEVELLDQSHGAVEHDPGHDLRMGEVPSRPAGLPDAIVRLTPDRLDVFDERPPARPVALLDPSEKLGAEEGRSEHLAVDVELELLGGRVA